MDATIFSIVHFFHQSEASIDFENRIEDEDQAKAHELLLLSHGVLRTIYNLGNQPTKVWFVDQLKIYNDAFNEIVENPSPNQPQLVNHHSEFEGNKLIGLYMGKDPSQFKYKTSGFGLLGKGLGFYAPSAIHLLIKHLSEGRKEDFTFQKAIKAVIAGCAEAADSVTASNQTILAIAIAMSATKVEEDSNQNSEMSRRRVV